MNQGPSPEQKDDEVCLGLSFQGLQISVRGPAGKALSFIQKITKDLEESQLVTSSSSGETTPSPLPVPPCPASLRALSAKLSAASLLSPDERVKRAWSLGIAARRVIEGTVGVEEPVVDIDLPNKYFVVAKCSSFEGAKIVRSAADFKRLLGGKPSPSSVGHGFPSETEARVYLAASGRQIPFEEQ